MLIVFIVLILLIVLIVLIGLIVLIVLIVLIEVQAIYSNSFPFTSLVERVLQLEFMHVSVAVQERDLARSPWMQLPYAVHAP